MMKTLNDYMAMSYRMEIIEDKEEGGFVVSYPDLPGCVTCGETVENYSGQFKLRIPRSLHRLLAEHSQSYCGAVVHYILVVIVGIVGTYSDKIRNRNNLNSFNGFSGF